MRRWGGAVLLSYLLEVVGEVLRLVEAEGLAGDERGADGVDALQDLLQVPVGLQGRQPQLDDQPVQLCGARKAGVVITQMARMIDSLTVHAHAPRTIARETKRILSVRQGCLSVYLIEHKARLHSLVPGLAQDGMRLLYCMFVYAHAWMDKCVRVPESVEVVIVGGGGRSSRGHRPDGTQSTRSWPAA